MKNDLEVKTVRAESNPRGLIVLGHAMFNTFDYFFKPKGKSLVDYLTQNGFDVTTFHLTGYGKSPKANSDTGFDQYVEDYTQFLNSLETTLPIYFIGHSVGGIAGFTAIAKSKIKLKKIILLAPALWPFTEPKTTKHSFKQRLQLKLMNLLSKPTGKFPVSIFGLGDVPAPHGHFYQLNRWAQLNQILSLDKTTVYTDQWKQISCPVRIYSGTKDTNMAPPENVRWVKNQMGQNVSASEEKADHFGLIYGKSAAQNMWPKFTDFFTE